MPRFRRCGSIERRRRFLRDDTVGSRTVGYNLKAVKVTLFIHAHYVLRTAEIPPAGAPSGFDFAAGRGCVARLSAHGAAPLRMTQWV